MFNTTKRYNNSDALKSHGFFEREKAIEKCTNQYNKLINIEFTNKHNNLFNLFLNSNNLYKSKKSKYFMDHCFYFNRSLLKNEYKYLYDLIHLFGSDYFLQYTQRINLFKNTIRTKNSKLQANFPDLLLVIKACYNLNILSTKFFYIRKYLSDFIKIDENAEDNINDLIEEEKKFDIFYNWLRNNGIKTNKLDLYFDPKTGIRGLYSIEDYIFNENLIYIPDNLLLELSKAEASRVGVKIRRYSDKIPHYETVLMALFLIEEALKSNSFWKPFINILPNDFASFPIFYSDKELELLKGYKLYEDIQVLKSDTLKYYEHYICVAAKEIFKTDYCSIVTYEIFLWAFANVKSRAFSFNKDGLEQMALSPFADLINHDINKFKFLWRYSTNYKGFIIYSVMNGSFGSEIFLNYGVYSTEDILKNYGFITENNPKDSIYLNIELSPDDMQFYLKYRLLKKNSLKNKQFLPLNVDLTDDRTIKFLNLFRFFCYREDLNKYIKSFFNIEEEQGEDEKEEESDSIKQMNIRMKYQRKNHKFNKDVLTVDYLFNNLQDEKLIKLHPKQFTSVDIYEEINMIDQLKKVLITKLNSFNDTLVIENYENNKEKEDLLTINERNILKYKLSQKNTLKFFMEFCNVAKLALNMKIKAFTEYLKTNREKLRPYEFYLETTVLHLITLYNN